MPAKQSIRTKTTTLHDTVIEMPRRVGYNWGMSDERTYIHGFTEVERDWLSRQSLSLEPYVFGQLDYSLVSRMLMKAFWGICTAPTLFIRFLPSFCFLRTFILRVMSPP